MSPMRRPRRHVAAGLLLGLLACAPLGTAETASGSGWTISALRTVQIDSNTLQGEFLELLLALDGVGARRYLHEPLELDASNTYLDFADGAVERSWIAGPRSRDATARVRNGMRLYSQPPQDVDLDVAEEVAATVVFDVAAAVQPAFGLVALPRGQAYWNEPAGRLLLGLRPGRNLLLSLWFPLHGRPWHTARTLHIAGQRLSLVPGSLLRVAEGKPGTAPGARPPGDKGATGPTDAPAAVPVAPESRDFWDRLRLGGTDDPPSQIVAEIAAENVAVPVAPRLPGTASGGSATTVLPDPRGETPSDVVEGRDTAAITDAGPPPPRSSDAAPSSAAESAPGAASGQVAAQIRAEQAQLALREAIADEESLLAGEQRSLRQAEHRLYQAEIAAAVRKAWRPPVVNFSIGATEVLVRQTPRGEVTAVEITTSAGDPAFDRSVELAVHRASPLPAPPYTELYAPTIRLVLGSDGVRVASRTAHLADGLGPARPASETTTTAPAGAAPTVATPRASEPADIEPGTPGAGAEQAAAGLADGETRAGPPRPAPRPPALTGRQAAPATDATARADAATDEDGQLLELARSAASVDPHRDRTLRSRQDIRELQQLLTRLDLDPGPADGLAGERSRAAIRALQRRLGVAETGDPTAGVLAAARALARRSP